MSFDIDRVPEYEKICCTSVYDAMLKIKNSTDIRTLRLALKYERLGQRRSTLIRALSVRIRKLDARVANDEVGQKHLDNAVVDNHPGQDSILKEVLTKDDRLRPDQGGLL